MTARKRVRMRACAIFMLGALLAACSGAEPAGRPVLIPLPQETTWNAGSFRLSGQLRVGIADTVLLPAAGYLCEALSPYAAVAVDPRGRGDLVLKIDSAAMPAEGYRLSVTRSGVRIEGGSYRGVVNGIATLRQLLPAAAGGGAGIPCAEIADRPAFEWRGVMLDVSRHFFDKGEILTLLDQMARLKLNKFHWHLTDDQGWRVEIRRYPELTEKGAWRHFNKQDTLCLGRAVRECNDDFLIPARRLRTEGADTLYGGYYTRQDIREVVAYAAVRGIDVIPEIDMPGHFLQAIEHYPWLACFGRGAWGSSFSSPLCMGDDRVLEFCENVWKEIFELFPYEYVHLGGDEVDMSNWERCPACRARMRTEGIAGGEALQAWFMQRMQRFFEAHGRRMIGWDEILGSGPVSGTAVMWWRPWEPQSVSRAVRQGCEVILCPQSWFYFSLDEDAGALSRVWNFDMLPDSLPDTGKRLVKGVQGNLWTEKIPSWSRAEHMLYPRLLILAEKGWGAAESDEAAFMERLLRYCGRLDAEGINYRIPSLTNYHEISVFTDSVRTCVACPLPDAVLRYTLDGSVPTVNSPRYDAPLTIREDCTLRIRPFHADGRTGDWITVRYEKQDYARPLEPRAAEPGLCVEWYFRRFPGCDAIGEPDAARKALASVRQPRHAVADGRCVVDSVCFPRAAAGRRAVGMIFRGYIDIPRTGIYTFALASDDGAILRIGDRVVIDNDGEHPLFHKTGQAALAAGLHPLELRYFDYNGGMVSLSLIGADGRPQSLDGRWLHHDPDTICCRKVR